MSAKDRLGQPRTKTFIRATCGRAILVFLFLFICSGIGAQTTRAPEAPPPPATAPAMERLQWLAANPSHSAVLEVFSGVIRDLPTVSDVLALKDSVISGFSSASVRHGALTRLASIARTARQFGAAVALYEEAFVVSGGADLKSLYHHAQILLELGDLSGADERARTVIARTDDYELKRRAATLAVRVLYQRGDLDIALSLLETLTSLDDREFVEPETLLLRLRIAEQIEDEMLIAMARQQLQHLFPESAAQLAETNRDVSPSGFPSSLLVSSHWSVGENLVAESSATRERLQPAITAVQVGSFSDLDNALHLARTLRELDLDARAEAVMRDGLTLQQVLIAVPDGTAASASRIIGKLREHSYDGFLVY